MAAAEDKTKEQLLQELKDLHRRIPELEALEAGHKETIEEREKYLYEMKERVKELSCMFGIAKSIRESETLEAIFRDTVSLIPPALQYPEITCACIRFLGNEYTSESFKETEWKLSIDILYDGKPLGSVEVYYTEERPEEAEGPFLKEERHLINGIARMLRETIERKQTQEALLESEEKFRMISASAQDAILIMDNDGKISFWNESAVRIFGWTAEEALGKDLHLFLAPKKFNEDYRKGFEEFRRTGEGIAVGKLLELSALRKDGTEFPIELSVAAAKLKGKWNAIGILRDISERKRTEDERRRLEEQMVQSQKIESIGVLAGGLAHQFNNLLMALLGNVELIIMDMHPDAPIRESVAEIEKVSRRMAKLVKELLAYAGRGKLIVEAIDLTHLFREILQLLQVSISKKADLQYTLDEELPSIEADASQLRQVILNLVANASEALGKQEGVISVRTGVKEFTIEDLDDIYGYCNLLPGRYVFLEVSDTGGGMDEALLPKIFDPFFSTKFTGRGLGLAAALGIVNGLHGAIKVHSKPGSGSAFTVLFPPLDQDAEDRGRESIGAWVTREKKTILVVDDEEPIRKVLKQMLEHAGYTVRTANDGREAVDLFRTCPDEIDCVFLDLTMPLLNGRETLAELRQIREDVRVILSSGYSEQEAIKNFDGKALFEFIQKPFNAADLLAKVKQILGT